MKFHHFIAFFGFFTSCVQSTQPENCSSVRDGHFIEVYGDTIHITIDRKGARQIESSELGTSRYKITWTAECDYESQLQETTIDYSQKHVGKKYKIKILTIQEDGYTYSCQMEGKDLILESSVKRIK